LKEYVSEYYLLSLELDRSGSCPTDKGNQNSLPVPFRSGYIKLDNMNCGIYKIQSLLVPSRIYIGSSFNIKRRWERHNFDLIHNKHHSLKLQRHYNKYGVSDLQFIILTECDKNSLLLMEQFFIDSYNPYFNNSKSAFSNLGSVLSSVTRKKMSDNRRGKCRTQETKDKISKGLTGRIIRQETREKMRSNNMGKVLSLDTRKKMSETRSYKYLKLKNNE
jgi:group I intron endonuclease